MSKLLKILFIGLTLTLLLTINLTAQAQDTGAFSDKLRGDYMNYLERVGQAPGYETSPEDASGILTNLIALIISLVGVIFLILIIYSGFQWMTASGNEEKITGARKRMTRASIGLGITLCAFVLSYSVFSFFYQEYLYTPPEGLEPPSYAQEEIPCTGPNGSTPAECADRQPRVYCFEGNCVECFGEPEDPNPYCSGQTHRCHPTWHICMVSEGTQCTQIENPGLCQAQNCKWIVTGIGDGGTWDRGRCVEASHPCYQCPQNMPVCVEILGQGMSCVECVKNKARGSCTTFEFCTANNTCMGI